MYHTNQKRYQLCNKCGFDANDLESLICENCEQPLTPKKEQKARNNLTLVEQKSTTENQGKRKKPRPKVPLRYIFPVAGAIGILTLGMVAYNLNASPTAIIKRAKGTISFGGEPCSRGFMLEEFAKTVNKLNPKVRFRYTDNDKNKDQIQELIEGQIQIAFSEKAFLDEHIERAKKRGIKIKAIPYAYDGITYITDKTTKVRPLTILELEAIYEGKITNWKQLGGEDKLIIPILMDGLWVNPMGIRLDDGLNPNTKLVKGERSQAKKILKNTSGAIFYTSATLAVDELDRVNVISIKKKDGTIVSPILGKGMTNQRDILSGKYPLVRALNVIVNSSVFENDQNIINPQAREVRAFIQYLLSPSGQALVEDAGFVAKYEVANDPETKKSFLPWF